MTADAVRDSILELVTRVKDYGISSWKIAKELHLTDESVDEVLKELCDEKQIRCKVVAGSRFYIPYDCGEKKPVSKSVQEKAVPALEPEPEPVPADPAPASEAVQGSNHCAFCDKELATPGKARNHEGLCGKNPNSRRRNRHALPKAEPSNLELSGKPDEAISDKSVPASIKGEEEKEEEGVLTTCKLSTMDQAKRNELVLDALKPFIQISAMALCQTMGLPMEEVDAALSSLQKFGLVNYREPAYDGGLVEWYRVPKSVGDALNKMGGKIEDDCISASNTPINQVITFTSSMSSEAFVEELKRFNNRDRKEELMTELENSIEAREEPQDYESCRDKEVYDGPVNTDVAHQAHYEDSALQPIEVMRANFSPEMFKGFLLGNVIKYTMRFDKKDGVKDLEKAQVYLGWLVDHEKKAVI